MKFPISLSLFRYVAGVAAFGLLGTSCKKYLEAPPPPDSIGRGEAFIDSATATSTVLGIYGGIASGSSSVVFTSFNYGSMSADDGYYLNATYDIFEDNVLAAGNDAVTLWNSLYARIGRTNFAIEGLTASTTLTASAKGQLLGEVKFWRAWLYFNLTNYWGDVPLIITTDAVNEALKPRTARTQVYEQIVKDLVEAKALLTDRYPSTERARINKKAVSAFLSRVYLYTSNWAGAEAEATEVISSPNYGIANLANVFTNTSTETIWQISLAGTSIPATTFGAEYLPPAGALAPTFALYDTLANTFEAGDQRKVSWTNSIVAASGKTYYYPNKYKLRQATAGNEYPVMLRLAEVYLNRSEARAKQDNISGAQDDLNVVRGRAGLGITGANNKDALLLALEKERWVELFTEGADRWFNLKRLGKATQVLSATKPKWKPFQELYPIPRQAISTNPFLIDNDGYR